MLWTPSGSLVHQTVEAPTKSCRATGAGVRLATVPPPMGVVRMTAVTEEETQ
jgi:hypothetical protein